MTTATEKLERVEPYLLRSMGAYGYLKVPRGFQEKFNYDRDTVKDPDAFFSETETEARLTFVFRKTGKHLADSNGQPSVKPARKGDEPNGSS